MWLKGSSSWSICMICEKGGIVFSLWRNCFLEQSQQILLMCSNSLWNPKTNTRSWRNGICFWTVYCNFVKLLLECKGFGRSCSASLFARHICGASVHQDLERRRFPWPTCIISGLPGFTCKLLVQAKACHGFFAKSKRRFDYACLEWWTCQQSKSASIPKFSTQEAGYEFYFQPSFKSSKSEEMPRTRKEVWCWLYSKKERRCQEQYTARSFDGFDAFGLPWKSCWARGTANKWL